MAWKLESTVIPDVSKGKTVAKKRVCLLQVARRFGREVNEIFFSKRTRVSTALLMAQRQSQGWINVEHVFIPHSDLGREDRALGAH